MDQDVDPPGFDGVFCGENDDLQPLSFQQSTPAAELSVEQESRSPWQLQESESARSGLASPGCGTPAVAVCGLPPSPPACRSPDPARPTATTIARYLASN